MIPFVHLHVHSQYSILDGMSSIPKMVDKAINDGMKGMALTDHGNMFGIKELFDYCGKVNKGRKKEGLEPFKPIFGCEMYVARHNKEDMVAANGDRGGNHLIVLAKNFNGYKNLIKLVSRAWTDGFYGRPRTDHKDLAEFHEDLIVSAACLAGEPHEYIRRALRLGRYASETLTKDELLQKADDAVKWYKDLFGEDYYIELMRHKVTRPEVVANRETYEEQMAIEPYLIDLARKYDIKLICTNDSHFVDEENAEAHDHLLCLSTGKDLNDPNRMRYSKQEWFKTQEEMNNLFADIPESLSNTLEILDKVETYDIDSNPIMPFFPIPEEFGTEEQWRSKYNDEDIFKEFTSDENGENPMSREDGEAKIKKLGGYDKLYRIKFEADYLAKLAYEGAQRIYGSGTADNITADKLVPGTYGIPSDVEERIRFELHIMKTMGFPGYFLIVSDFINSAREELGVWVGPGRGSAAGSVVAYCLGITKLDPLKYDLLFERFLNPDRISLPDIDTDFDDDGRGKVLQWVMDKYGHENCAHIITYGTMAAKNSIKDVARVEQVPLSIVNAWCKAMPDRLPDGMKPKLANYLKCTPELQQAASSVTENERNTIAYAQMLEGTVRNTGIHACGFIICRDPISDHVPVSTADDPDFPEIKTAVTQYDGHVIESTGLIKMDFLGLKTLSEMKECVKLVKQTLDIDIDLDNIPIDDELTFKLYQEGRTVGTFQFESAGMQKYLRELKPTVFEDLIAMNALYRPGPLEYIPSFIRRKNGQEDISYDLPIMEKYLKDTYGVTVYQEQVMLLSRLLANFTRGESDKLRKAMGKKQMAVLQELKPKFIDGGKSNGHPAETLEKIWKDWEAFASYAFNKSHAACYSWVAYQTAYLKAHYPAQFLAALMTRRKSDIKEISKMMDESKAMGIRVLGPDINESNIDFTVNAKGEIRFGLGGIKGVGSSAVQAVIDERTKGGPFKDIYDVVERINLSSCNRKAIENFALAGAFDCFGEIKREDFFDKNTKGESFSEVLVKFGQKFQAGSDTLTGSLFGDLEPIEIAKPVIPNAERWNNMELLNKERDLVGMFLSAHPLDVYYLEMKYGCNLELSALEEVMKDYAESGKTIVVGGIVVDFASGMTKRGSNYGRLKVEDYNGSYEFMLFDRDYLEFCKFGQVGLPIIITGSFQKSRFNDKISFKIRSIDLLNEKKGKMVHSIKIHLNDDEIEKMQVLKDMMNASTENRCDLYFRVTDCRNSRPVDLMSKLKLPLNKKIITMLQDMDLKFEINV